MKLRQFVLAGLLSLVASPAFATIYHTNKLGSDGNSCATASSTTAANAKLTVRNGVRCLSPGDTLIIYTGTYNETLEYSNGLDPMGAGFSSGTPGNPITWMANPGDTVIINGWNGTQAGFVPPNSTSVVDLLGTKWLNIGPGIEFDGRYSCGPSGASTCPGNTSLITTNSVNSAYPNYPAPADIFFDDMHVTIQGNSFHRSAINAIFINSVGVDVVGNHMYDNGRYRLASPPGGYCLYDTSSQGLIENNHCETSGRYGFQFYSQVGYSHDNVVRGNIIHDNGIDQDSGGITVLGYNQQIYNNVIYRNVGPGIDVDSTEIARGDVKIYHNTIYGQTSLTNTYGYCVTIGLGNGADGVKVANNICRNNAQGNICQGGTGSGVCAGGHTTSITYATNICQATGTGCTIAGDPGFVDSGAGDFRLAVNTSPAIDVGTPGLGITTDILNIPRPQGVAVDLGAYEFFGDVVPGPMRISEATDSFTTASNQLISAYDAAHWTVTNTNGSGTDGCFLDAATDRVYCKPALTVGFLAKAAARIDSGLWSNNHASSCKLATLPSLTGESIACTCRNQASTNFDAGRYEFILVPGGSTFLRSIFTSQVENLGTDSTAPWAIGDDLECDAIGNQIRGLRNGSALVTATDNRWPSGKPGLAGSGTSVSSAAITSWEGFNFDAPDPPSGAITIQSPISGVTFSRPNNQQVSIQWTPEDLTGNVDLQYGIYGCSGYMYDIATVAYNSSPYVWDAAVPASATMVVKVKQGGTSACSEQFTLKGKWIK